jgi:hypothetical protein
MSIRHLGRARLMPLSVAAVSVVSLGMATGTAAAGISSAAASARAGATQHWRIVARSNSALTTIIAPSTASAWAMGVGATRTSAFRPAGEHWNGHRWSTVAFPKTVASGIGCAGSSSPGNVWAFAGATAFAEFSNYAAALHLVGGKWLVSKTFTPPGLVSGCSVLGRGNVWLYGLTHVAPGVGTWRLSGRTWKPVRHTGNIYLVTASTVSANDVWAIAAGSLGLDNVVAHWNGRTWSRNRALGAVLPPPSASVTPTITAINAVARGNVWISAEVSKQKKGVFSTTLLVLHLSGGKWHKVGRTSPGYYLPAAVSDGHGGWWAPGPTGLLPPVRATPPYLLHETGGHWRHVPLPVVSGAVLQVTGIVHVPGSNAMLAIGQLYNGLPRLRSVVMAYGRLPR